MARTTLTLDADVEALLRRTVAATGMPFKAVVNDAIRNALAGGEGQAPYRLAPLPCGNPMIALTKALRVADALEDDELVRKLAQGR